MDSGQAFAVIMVAMAMLTGVLVMTSMLLSHRRSMAEIKHGKTDREAVLSEENGELRETVSLMQDRLAVLEQIATDPARRTADEIEQLR